MGRRLLRGLLGMSLKVMPCDLKEANAFVSKYHRHHFAVVGHKFSLACVDGEGVVRGVCIVGRPVARLAGDKHHVCEVTRLCTDGTRNACSILYGAAARVARAMGFCKIQTYTLPGEGGASLRGAGWRLECQTAGGPWVRSDGKPRRRDQPESAKYRWALVLSDDARPFNLPSCLSADCAQHVLWADA